MGEKFWKFSVAVYRNEAVQAECLALQDQFGLDVNLVLLCAYLGAVHGASLTVDDVSAARLQVREWHDGIVRALRGARRTLKTVELPDAATADAAQQLRIRVKAAELESERIEQAVLEDWADKRLPSLSHSSPSDAVYANFRAVLAAYGVDSGQVAAGGGMRHLIAVALAAAA